LKFWKRNDDDRWKNAAFEKKKHNKSQPPEAVADSADDHDKGVPVVRPKI